MQARRLLSLSGAAIVALVASVVVLGNDTPGSDAHGSTIAAYYHDHQVASIAATFLIGLVAPLLVAFGVTLASARRGEDDGHSSASELVLLGGAVLAAAAFLVTAAFQFALADVPDKLSGGALQALNVLFNDMWAAWNPALGVMMLGAAATLRPCGGSRRVLGSVAAAIGVALFVPFADFVALLATGVWFVAASVVLYRNQAPAPRYAAQPRTA